ncbi:MAG TPA: hypothetical protein VJA94_07915 [Candidatus Angelobacter sp.]
MAVHSQLMKERVQLAGVVVFCLVLCVSADDRKKMPQSHLKPGQTASIDTDKLITAKQRCENWAVAAGLETMLKQQNVALDQNFWVMRFNGGELCSQVPAPELLSHVVNNEFVLDDGRHVQLELQYLSGVPTNIDALIAALKEQKISLLLLRGHPYYLTGATYDEYVNRDGSRMFIVTELRLANTFAREPGLAFVKGRDNMDEISAVISVNVTPSSAHW